MNRTILSIYIVSVILLAIGGCKNEKSVPEPKDYHIQHPENILNAYNAGRPDWDMAIRSIGSVKIDVRDSVVILHHVPTFEPEVHYYFLQVKQKVTTVEPGYIEKAEIFYMDRNLLVNSLESKKTYLFSIESDPLPEYLKGIKGAISVEGFGIGVRKYFIGAEGGQVPFCYCVSPDFPTGNCKTGKEVGPVNCTSAIETGACRVSCGSQYFACCDMKTFK